MKTDVYSKVTDQIVAALEQGVRPWMKPWSAEHAAGRITRPLRANGIPYQGINVLVVWSDAVAKGYSAPIWMTFRQALTLGANVRKGEKGSLVVYANTISRTETDRDTNEETVHDIHYMKGYTVFNVAQIEGLPAHYYGKPAPPAAILQRIGKVERFFAATGADIRHGAQVESEVADIGAVGTDIGFLADHDIVDQGAAFASSAGNHGTVTHVMSC